MRKFVFGAVVAALVFPVWAHADSFGDIMAMAENGNWSGFSSALKSEGEANRAQISGAMEMVQQQAPSPAVPMPSVQGYSLPAMPMPSSSQAINQQIGFQLGGLQGNLFANSLFQSLITPINMSPMSIQAPQAQPLDMAAMSLPGISSGPGWWSMQVSSQDTE